MRKRAFHKTPVRVVVAGLVLAAALELYLRYLKAVRYDSGSLEYVSYVRVLPYVAVGAAIWLFVCAIRTLSVSAVVTMALIVASVIGTGTLISRELKIQSPNVIQLSDGSYIRLQKMYGINGAGKSIAYTGWLSRCDSFHLRLSNCELIWIEADANQWHLRDDVYLTYDRSTNGVSVIAVEQQTGNNLFTTHRVIYQNQF
ncbi:MAG: hypothetical protein AAF787_15250 [Chloroflexota bacterium]